MMLWVTDAERGAITITGPVTVGPGGQAIGTLFAVDTLRRVGELLRIDVTVHGMRGDEALNVHGGRGLGKADVVLYRPGSLALSPVEDPLALRLSWLSGDQVSTASRELQRWRGLVAAWAEHPSKPICADVQEQLLTALANDLETVTAIGVLRGSLDLGLPEGCLFETWAWADRLLGLDLARDVGR